MTVGSNTMVSRVLGLVRDVVIAKMFGAGSGADAFFVAFRIPNFLRRLFAEGAFAQAFVPILSEYKEQGDTDAVRDLVAHTAGLLGVVVLLVTSLGIVAAPALIAVFAPGFVAAGGDKLSLSVEMLRIMFPYLAFISLTALVGGVLNTYGRFGVPAFTPVLLNVAIISSALLLAPTLDEPVLALAWGVCAGGLAQLLFQVPFLARLGLLARPRLKRTHAGVTRILKLMAPAVFGASVGQINLLVDTLLASFLVTGSVSWLYYSDRLMEFPLGVFGVALATVILPRLSAEHATKDRAAFSETMDWALRWGLLIAIPASVGLAVLAGPLLTTLFQYGAFTGSDVRMASLSLVAYSIGLTGFIFVKILAPGYFARQDTRTPVKVGLIAMGANILFNFCLVFTLAHAGLALATALSSMLNAGLLYRGLVARDVYKPKAGWPRFSGAVITASLAMGAAVAWEAGPVDRWLAWGLTDRVTELAIAVAVGVGVYVVALLLLGVRPSHLRRPGMESGGSPSV
ncbi:MAG: murein biosynthesis integral membrane protein MurJ [Chromatiales bacterium]|nr:murein biosynthesis integral membrane protein MurJ [Chromatiales bacterium]